MAGQQAQQLMTVAEFGRRLGVSRATAYRIVAAGYIDRTPVGPGRAPMTRISEAALTRYLARREVRGRRAA